MEEPFLLAVAKAIEGPHSAAPDVIEARRADRWRSLTDEQRARRIAEARAAIAQVVNGTVWATGI